MKSSFTIRLQYSFLISGSTVGQSIGSSETTSSSCSSLDQAMYLSQPLLDLSNFSVAINHGAVIAIHLLTHRTKHSTGERQIPKRKPVGEKRSLRVGPGTPRSPRGLPLADLLSRALQKRTIPGDRGRS